MPFNYQLPEWNKSAPKPPQFKIDEGFLPEEKPPASIFNWFFNTVFLALQEIQQNAYTKTETDSTTQTKADTAENNAKNFVKSYGLGDVAKDISGTDLNTLDATGLYRGNNLTNSPTGVTSDYFFILHFKHSTTYKTQMAFKFATSSPVIYHRTNNNGSWSTWSTLETTAGAQAKADAVQTNLTTQINNARTYAEQLAATAEANAKAASAPISHVGAGGSAHALATPSSSGFMSGPDKSKLDSVQPGAEVNQNAFSNIKVGATTIAADAKQDTLELVAGTGMVLTPDATNDKVTIAVNTASTSQAGIVQLVDSVSSTSVTQAPTANAAKQAYDRAVSAENNAKNYLDSQKGQPNGVATLGPDGKVPASQLNISTSADAITISDSGGYYTSGNVEGALQEIGQVLNAMRGDLITSVNNVLNM